MCTIDINIDIISHPLLYNMSVKFPLYTDVYDIGKSFKDILYFIENCWKCKVRYEMQVNAQSGRNQVLKIRS